MKMYILVRNDLTTSQRAVQACHAVAELLRHNNKFIDDWFDNHKIMILLGVNDEKELLDWSNKLQDKAKLFYEPDINSYTALACCPSLDKSLFNDLRLLK